MTGPAFMNCLQEGGFGELLAEFESGRLSPEDFAGRVMELADLQLGYDEFVRGWEDIFWSTSPSRG